MTTTTSTLLRIKELNLECLDTTGNLRWSLPVVSLVLIAEYTTNEGPYADDYFLVFATLEGGKIYYSTCPASAATEGVLAILEQRLGPPMQLELGACTELRSRVAWPASMAGTEYFSFTEVPARTLAEKLKKKLLGPTEEYAVSKAVREYLDERLRSH